MMLSPDRRLLIRTDGGPTMGMGHVMRSIALAQAWRDLGGTVTLATALPLDGFRSRIAREGLTSIALAVEPGSRQDAEATVAVARSGGAGYVAMDGYSFGPDFQRTVSQAGVATACMDDYGHLDEYHVDMIVNQNLDSTDALYKRRPDTTRLLLGAEFAMLRSDFTKHARRSRVARTAGTRVLVTLGGADPQNVTSRIVQSLGDVPFDIEAAIVIGGANPHLSTVVEAVAASDGCFRTFVDVPSLRRLMEWADVIVCGGGTTCWEAAFIGVPMIAIVLAENQTRIADALANHGAAINLGDSMHLARATIADSIEALLLDQSRRERMSSSGRGIVDGFGARRVAMAIASLRGAA